MGSIRGKDVVHAPRLLPERAVERWWAPVQRFLHVEAASGMILLACTVAALILANSPWAEPFAAIWKIPVVVAIGGFRLDDTLGHLIINDGLMTVFFFVVGLEVKREIVAGELADRRKALLPVVGAAGGMVLPAAIYLAFQWGEPGQRGWAIPMATDIAFVVGFLALFGPRIPFGLKIFLLSLAIVDDLGAVLIIALVFTDSLAWNWLSVGVVGFIVTYLLNYIGVRQVGVYVVVGAFIWLAFLQAGVHPTVAGVLLGLLTPASAWVDESAFRKVLDVVARSDGEVSDPAKQLARLSTLRFAAMEMVSPLHRLEVGLHPVVAFGIMPLFALANAGVPLQPSALTDPVAIAVAAGLAIGKPVGISIFCFLAVRLGVTALPAGVSWRMVVAGACLAGIGFTMALFLNGLAFHEEGMATLEAAGKIGTLTGSLISALLGAVLMAWAVSRPRVSPTDRDESLKRFE